MKVVYSFFYVILLSVVCSTGAFAVHSHITPEQKVLNTEVKSLYGVPFHAETAFTLGDVLRYSPKEFEAIYGVDLTMKQKLAYRFAKADIRYRMSQGDYELANMPSRSSGFTFLGFLLGFFFSLIGVLIAWLIWGRRGLISSLWGVLFGFILFIVGWKAR